jgi:hypothetical protein
MRTLIAAALLFLTACDGGGTVVRTAIWDATSALSLDEFALQRAHDLTGMEAPTIWHDPFFVAPGDARSQWLASSYDVAVAPTILPDGEGGVARFDTGTGVDGFALAGLAPLGTLVGIVGDPGAGASFYTLFRFRVPTPVTSASAIRLGLTREDTAATVSFGVRGASSTEFFRFSRGSAGVLSTVPIDMGWHQEEMWSPGDSRIYGDVDGEEPVSFAISPLGASLAPWIIVASGATVDPTPAIQVDIDDAVYVVP